MPASTQGSGYKEYKNYSTVERELQYGLLRVHVLFKVPQSSVGGMQMCFIYSIILPRRVYESACFAVFLSALSVAS